MVHWYLGVERELSSLLAHLGDFAHGLVALACVR